jgi:hypothetical protein
MDDLPDRRALKAEYRERRPDAAVYRIVNTRTGKSLLGTTPNVESFRNRMEFAKSTGSLGVVNGRLTADVREFGIDAFALEILEVLRPSPEQSRPEWLADLNLLEQLWREKLAGEPLY